MIVYVLVTPGQENLADATKFDVGSVDPHAGVIFINAEADYTSQIRALSQINFEAGDMVCMAGLCPRHTSFQIAVLAQNRRENYMPGRGTDHRGVPIPAGKISERLTIELNEQAAWPHLMIIGNPDTAKLSFELVEHLDINQYWPNYTPATITMMHILSIVALTGHWKTPDWFSVVDLSIWDLETTPIMSASHAWHDWIAFYPAAGRFKLENHAQLHPVWLAGSEKPLEYWQRVNT